MKDGDGLQGRLEMAASSAMVAKDAPVFEPGNRVLDPCSTPSMPTPDSVTHDAVAAESRRDELGHAAVAAIGQHAAVHLRQDLDARAPIVDRIVAVTRTSRDHSDDSQIASSR